LNRSGQDNPPAILLLGPTASGKSMVALQLVERLPLEIVSVDSAQVFVDMNVGTAKPDAETLRHVPHHLVDLITPEQRYSAARFRADALRAMTDITARGKIPLLVGGTMLYFKALCEGLAELPDADAAVRDAIDAEASEKGWPALHAELAKRDPDSAARLDPTDAQRIQRALEVVRVSGKTLGHFFDQQQTATIPYRTLVLGLAPTDRAWLHERIAMRFDQMLAEGLVDEVMALRGKYSLNAGLPSMRCVGYRQAWEVIEGQMPARELRDRGIFATRQLAKRQLTWLNGWRRGSSASSLKDIALIDCQKSELAATIGDSIERFAAALCQVQ
jgi:tRNA dimethylallyltransferase